MRQPPARIGRPAARRRIWQALGFATTPPRPAPALPAVALACRAAGESDLVCTDPLPWGDGTEENRSSLIAALHQPFSTTDPAAPGGAS